MKDALRLLPDLLRMIKSLAADKSVSAVVRVELVRNRNPVTVSLENNWAETRPRSMAGDTHSYYGSPPASSRA